MGNNIHYFIDTNFPQKESFKDSNFNDLKMVLNINNCLHSVIGKYFNILIEEIEKQDLDVDIIHDSFDNSVKGLIIPSLSVGILYEQSFGDSTFAERACEYFKSAGKIHDQLEKIYIQSTDFDKLDAINEKLIKALFEDKYIDKKIQEKDRFFGAMTTNNSVNYIDCLTKNFNKRYFIKGRAGTGKSTFMKKIAKVAIERGFDVEKYHCAFAPDSLDMVVVRSMGICIFDSTAPHEMFPSKKSDEIIDVYRECVIPGTDEKYEEEIEYFSSMYSELIQMGRDCLKEIAREREKYNKQNGFELKIEEKEFVNIIMKLIKSV